MAHLIFSTAAGSTSSLYHPLDALGVLPQRATLVGLITIRPQGNALRQNQKEKPPFWVVFFLVRRTDLDTGVKQFDKLELVVPSNQMVFSNRFCGNLQSALVPTIYNSLTFSSKTSGLE